MQRNLTPDELKLFEDLEQDNFVEPRVFYRELLFNYTIPLQVKELYDQYFKKKMTKTQLSNKLREMHIPSSLTFRGLYVDLIKGKPIKVIDISKYLDNIHKIVDLSRKIGKPFRTIIADYKYYLSLLSKYLKNIHKIVELSRKIGKSTKTIIEDYKHYLSLPKKHWRIFEYRFYAVREKAGKHTPDRQLEIIMTAPADYAEKDKVYDKAMVVVKSFLKAIDYGFLLSYTPGMREETDNDFIETAYTMGSPTTENWTIKYGARWLEDINEPNYAGIQLQLNDYQYNTVRYRASFVAKKEWWKLPDNTLEHYVMNHWKKVRESIGNDEVRYKISRYEWLNHEQPTLWRWM